MATSQVKRNDARRIYLETGNASETARRVGVHRATFMRWLKDGLLAQDVVDSSIPDNPQVSHSPVEALVPKAIALLDSALEGGPITPNQLRTALEVVKSSNALKAAASTQEKKASLADLISKLDAEVGTDSD